MNDLIKQAVVSSDNYTELKTMMISNDVLSVNLALTILEQSDFEKSQIYILCLLKETSKEDFFNNSSKFKKECPLLHEKVTEKLLDHDTNIASLSFRKIYEIAVSRKKKLELSFMLNVFKKELMSLLGDYGFTFLEYIDIELKPKKI
jgi:hypothetical protein